MYGKYDWVGIGTWKKKIRLELKELVYTKGVVNGYVEGDTYIEALL